MTIEEKAKRYDETIERAKEWYSDVQIGIWFKGNLEKLFPELKESEDERIREALIALLKFGLKDGSAIAPGFNETKEQALAWLEKQSKSDESLYIRFGNIPINGKSKVYNGEIEIGIEEGISVYPAFEDKEGNIILGLNLPITKTSLYTQQHLLEYDNRPCYLVTGDYVGKGTDGEPLLKNVRIIKEIKPYRIKQGEKPQGKSALETINEEKVDNANEVEPKFKVGDKIKYNYPTTDTSTLTIITVEYDKNRYVVCDKPNNYNYLSFFAQDNFNLIRKTKFDTSTLVPFDSRVLVRDNDYDVWRGAFWSHLRQKADIKYDTIRGVYRQCIPYNDDTKHLLGTTNDCDEYYKTWEE